MSSIDLTQKFYFPDIPGQPFPVYLKNRNGRTTNFKSIIYPSPGSCKKYTRRKQLSKRSFQAKIFDALINIGYFEPLTVYREFPVPVQNYYRLPGQTRLYYILDYYFPNLSLAVELDSDLHDDQKDGLRDEYLEKAHGIQVFRIKDLQKESVQKGKFRDLVNLLKSRTPNPSPPPLVFTNDLFR